MMLLLTLASLISCTRNSGGFTPAPQPQPAGPQQPGQPQQQVLQGSVVKLFIKLLLPQAHAMAMPIPPSVAFDGTIGEVPQNAGAVSCAASRCALLVDTGRRDSGSVKAESDAKIVAATPVVNGNFRFQLSLQSDFALAKADMPQGEEGASQSYEGRIYKVVIRNWDQASQEAAAPSVDDREYTLSSAEIRAMSNTATIEVTPESTLAANHKVESLKTDMASMDQSVFIQIMVKIYQASAASVREGALAILAMMSDSAQDSSAIRGSIASEDIAVYQQELTFDAQTTNFGAQPLPDLLIALDKMNANLTKAGQVRHDFFVSQDLQSDIDASPVSC